MSQSTTVIDHREYGFIMNSRYSSFSEEGDLPFTPIFIDPILHIATISALYNDAVNRNVYGIRIYPGLTVDNQLVLITCDAMTDNTPEEENYRIFEYAFYMAPNTLPATVDMQIARECHNLYLQRVKVEGDVQPPLGSSLPHIRKSRTYPWLNIKEFVEENVTDGRLSDPATLGDLFMKLETGYIPSYLQSQFLIRQPVAMPDHLRGFCVVFSLLTQNGVPLEQADKLVDDNSPTIYAKNYLDIGRSCPPMCGILE